MHLGNQRGPLSSFRRAQSKLGRDRIAIDDAAEGTLVGIETKWTPAECPIGASVFRVTRPR